MKEPAAGVGADPLRPEKARIIRIQPLPQGFKLFQVRFDDEQLNREFDCRPGQFLMLSVVGVGEAPFAIASPPSRQGFLELCIHRAGRVTTALHRLKENAVIGIRGPYGNGYPIEAMQKSDVLLLAEGLYANALRPLLWYILDTRKDFGQVTLVMAVDSLPDLPLHDEFLSLLDREDITCRVCPSPAQARAGAPSLIERVIAELRPQKVVGQNTYAVLAGEAGHFPPLWDHLLQRGISKDKILFSLQRKMRCGIGKCGHCSIGHKHTCLDGPIFSYWDAQNLPEVI
ncbi:MAG: iron-sulfur cluster-binding protein [Bacillota bacterium]